MYRNKFVRQGKASAIREFVEWHNARVGATPIHGSLVNEYIDMKAQRNPTLPPSQGCNAVSSMTQPQASQP